MRGFTWANDNGTDERVREDPRERERRRIAALRKLLEAGGLGRKELLCLSLL